MLRIYRYSVLGDRAASATEWSPGDATLANGDVVGVDTCEVLTAADVEELLESFVQTGSASSGEDDDDWAIVDS